jgi:uncharacterized protein YuzE
MSTPMVTYDPEADAAYIRFSAGKVEESEEVAAGIVLDYDEEGRLVGMEVLHARAHLPPDMLGEAA